MMGWLSFCVLTLGVCALAAFMFEEEDRGTPAASVLFVAAVAAGCGACITLFVMVTGAVG